MSRLPVLLSIPHGGLRVPPEIEDRVCLNREELFHDADAFTREIYDLGARVEAVISTDIARAFVDLNRAPEDRPPANPDGVVKSSTSYGEPVYCEGLEPDDRLVELLLGEYHAPYHRRIEAALQNPALELALDCHSMASVGPGISPDPGQRRPAICLSNVRGRSCPRMLLERLARCFRSNLGLPAGEVKLNRPFAGGYITRTHGGGRVPFIQVEMSRALYLKRPWFDEKTLQVDGDRLKELRERFHSVLVDFFAERTPHRPDP